MKSRPQKTPTKSRFSRKITPKTVEDGPDILVFAVDGHHIDHAVHSPNDHKGGKVSSNNLYLLCLHTGLVSNRGAVQKDERQAHEMPVFRYKNRPWLRSGP
jgi:hypothetical protein